MKVEALHHDEVRWGDGPDERDPQPGATLYFTVWGFALLFATILFLQALTWGYQNWERGRKGSSDGGAIHLNKSEQEARLKRGSAEGKPINRAMADVVKQYGKRK